MILLEVVYLEEESDPEGFLDIMTNKYELTGKLEIKIWIY